MLTGETNVTTAAMRLPPKKRARLVSALLASLAFNKKRAIAEAWADEAQARSEAYRQGQLKTVSVAEGFGFTA